MQKEPRETTVQLWGKVLIPHQGIHTISLSCFADTEVPKWEKFTVNDGMQPMGSLVAQLVKNLPTMQQTQV